MFGLPVFPLVNRREEDKEFLRAQPSKSRKPRFARERESRLSWAFAGAGKVRRPEEVLPVHHETSQYSHTNISGASASDVGATIRVISASDF